MTALDEILEQAAGEMVADEDLGVELKPETAPVLEKQIIREVNHRRCLVIIADQMLESIPQATGLIRAETSSAGCWHTFGTCRRTPDERLDQAIDGLAERFRTTALVVLGWSCVLSIAIRR